MSKKEVKKKASPKPSGQSNFPPQKPAPKEPSQPEVKAAPAPQSAGKRVSVKVNLPEQPKRLSERQLVLQSHRDETRSRRKRNLTTIGAILALVILVVVGIIFGSRQPTLTATVKSEGTFNCFPAGLSDESGTPVNCQTSPVLYDGTNLYFGSAAPIPGTGYSALFSMPFSNETLATDQITYKTEAPVLQAQDFESMAISKDRDYVFAMTGFDRVDTANSDLNGYNMLLAWPVADPSKVQVVSATTTPEGVTSSVSMRNKFAQVLDNAAYIKVTGLTAIPGNYLLVGIGELGQSKESAQPAFKIISIPFSVNKDSGEINLSDRYEVKYTIDLTSVNPDIPHKLSLSSLEYDPYQNRLVILTNYQEGDKAGAYLWVLSINDLTSAQKPLLVSQADGTPFEFSHNAEGLTVIGQNTYLVSFNDEAQAGSEPQQAAYQIIELSR